MNGTKKESNPISYKPLRLTLVDKDMDINQLGTENGGVLNKGTVSKLRKNGSVNILTLAKICEFLDVPIEEVVEINY